jgi:tRNA dimethylallyltransferase
MIKKDIAIIGATASGKSALALEIAQKTDSLILSLDSLSIYKDIDIVSAKPTKDELKIVKHFGINEIYPNDYFSVTKFIELYQKAKQEADINNKNLIIVGGSSFYLKALIDGLSVEPNITKEVLEESRERLINLEDSFKLLQAIDPIYMEQIKSNDKYRIEKALNIYLASNLAPSEYFKQNPKKQIIKDIQIFNIDIDREIVRDKIKIRTKNMLNNGLLDEIKFLEEKYSRTPRCFGAIGIKESFDYFDGIYTEKELYEKISINTGRLAKRQQTFNKTQFKENIISLPIDYLRDKIFSFINEECLRKK